MTRPLPDILALVPEAAETPAQLQACLRDLVTLVSLPAFWTGLLLVLAFSVGLRWLPSTGYDGPLSLILPSVTLASLSAAATSSGRARCSARKLTGC